MQLVLSLAELPGMLAIVDPSLGVARLVIDGYGIYGYDMSILPLLPRFASMLPGM